ncbi:MAG: redoxin family protein [Gammaproteobacteria bacterium]|nr:redoxin family protein [Gammaproteobacteria bacterium]
MSVAFFLNLIFAFIEGFALILSPCILPILPIMLSGSLEGGKQRPYGIIFGFILVFATFTAGSRLLAIAFHLDLSGLRYLAFAFIALFGVILASESLSRKFEQSTRGLAQIGFKWSEAKNKPSGGFLSGFILGGLVSLIWVPCGGPILAIAIVQSAIQQSNWGSFFTFLVFALGSVIPMMLIALLGRKIMQHISFLKSQGSRLRKIFGFIIILGAGLAVSFDAGWLSAAPRLNNTTLNDSSSQLIDALSQPYPAPALKDSPTDWINSPPLTLSDLKGKVVLIDFWTYSCINCVRTLPYLKNWYAQYHAKGFEIIGVHTPEFQFEKDPQNVEAAVKENGILYPIVMDSNYSTWLNYNNQYWPAHYLIDQQGNVVATHFGEGNYAETEHNIRVLLGLKSDPSTPKANTASTPFFTNQTPETYLGSARSGTHQAVWDTTGQWNIQKQFILNLEQGTRISLHFTAKKVFLVGGATAAPIKVSVKLNGKKMTGFVLNRHDLYPILNLPSLQSGTLELTFQNPGAQLYTFTFGG